MQKVRRDEGGTVRAESSALCSNEFNTVSCSVGPRFEYQLLGFPQS